jgi:hypothetical protein
LALHIIGLTCGTPYNSRVIPARALLIHCFVLSTLVAITLPRFVREPEPPFPAESPNSFKCPLALF